MWSATIFAHVSVSSMISQDRKYCMPSYKEPLCETHDIPRTYLKPEVAEYILCTRYGGYDDGSTSARVVAVIASQAIVKSSRSVLQASSVQGTRLTSMAAQAFYPYPCLFRILYSHNQPHRRYNWDYIEH